MEHTAGPWTHVTGDGSVGTVEGVDGWAVALAQSRPNDPRHEERQANARLIAAAPELLEALQGVVSRCRNTGYIGMDGQFLKTVHTAIAKATGEAVTA